MSKHSFKDWLIAVRPWSFPASAMPVLVTLAYLHWIQFEIDWVNGMLALVGIVFFHASGNAWSDFHDYKYGVDTPNTFGVKTLTSGQFAPSEIRNLALGLLVPAGIVGVLLLFRVGLPLLWIGLGGLGCSLLYPWLKYRAWGDVVILMAYAILPTLGTSFVATGMFLSDVLLVAFPVGLITVAILHANNTRDITTDTQAQITTLAMKAGLKMDVFLYVVEILLPFAWIVACVFIGYFPKWSLLVLMALPLAIINMRAMLHFPQAGVRVIADLDEKTAKLQLLFSLLFTITFLI